jgi:N-acetylmuramoyl-L-alanine amidase
VSQRTKYLTSLRKLAFAISASLILANCTGMEMSPGQSSKTVEISASEHSCLAEAIYFEAGSTNDAGRRAVGEVILNRAADPRFPRTICGVVDQRYNGSCQFSYRCDSKPEEYRSAAVKSASEQMATTLMANRGEDITNGALFFRAAWAGSSWFNTLDPRGQFGGNVFYR